jgi:hypothetical protein
LVSRHSIRPITAGCPPLPAVSGVPVTLAEEKTMSTTLASILVATAVAAAPEPSQSDVCPALIAAWPTLHQQGTPLVAGAGGPTYESLYDECDAENKFAGKPLPNHSGKPLRCSTDPNRVEHLVGYPDGTVAFEAKAAVDADGSSLACVGHWPNQCGTWLQFDRGSARRDVDAEATSFIVVPTKTPDGMSFQNHTGIRQGDLAVVMWKGKCSFGVVGDAGPYYRLGEVSLRTHADLGHERCRNPGERPCRRIFESGIAEGVAYLIFPKSRPSPLTSENVQDVSREQGQRRVREFLERYRQAEQPPTQ